MTRRERAAAIAGGRTLVAGDLATVSWLTGLAPDIEWGPSPFSAAPLAVLRPDGSVLAVVSEDEAPGLTPGVEARTFPGFALEDVDRPAAARSAALEAIGDDTSLAVELHALPADLVAALDGRELRDVRGALGAARMVKDADELAAIRAAIALADAGQAAARTALRAGASELELWTETRAAMEAAAGERLPVLADFVTGERSAEVGGPPGARVVTDGDLLLVDLVPRLGAYWADSCATIALGEPPAAARAAHAAAVEALEAAKAAIRPGVSAGEIDAVARGHMEPHGGFPHHTGHGLGLTVHELPRLVPGASTPLEAGMVIALEPGAYGDGWGVRVEQVVLVTEDGSEVLSGHALEL
jgi:Xaa-Pro aminopeptidase